MPYTLIYNTIDRVQLSLTGNTIGLNGNLTVGQQGIQGTLGALITLNSASVFGNFPNGTTGDFTQDSSSAILQIPAGAEILRAQLTWSGYFDVNTRALVKNPVTFTTPSAGTVSIVPQISNYKVLNATSLAYSNTSDVTSLVSGPGTFSVGAIPVTLVNNDLNIYGGWTLQVAYSLPNLPFRAVALYYNQDLIGGAVSATQMLSGFSTPIQGTVRGRLVASAGEGDVAIVGDQLLFGPSDTQLTPVSGPNNFANNFFASQINGNDGLLDRSGTFGTRNNINGSPGTNVSGARQGWDITNVDISGFLTNGLTQVVTRATSTGDFYLIPVLGLQIDANSADLTLTKTSSPLDTFVGQPLTYIVTIANTSEVTASRVVFLDALSSFVIFQSDTLRVNGTVVSGANPSNGVSLPDIVPAGTLTVSYDVVVVGLPPQGILTNVASADFEFSSLPGGPIVSGSSSTSYSTNVFVPSFTITKTASTSQARVGDIITYQVAITNTGTIASSQGTLTDPLFPAVSFVPDSVALNGETLANANPAAGISLPSIPVGATLTITYQVQVNVVPDPAQIINQATASLDFVTSGGVSESLLQVSNNVVIPVFTTGVNVIKSADHAAAFVGESIAYTIIVANAGTTQANDVTVTDPLPDGTELVVGTVKVNGIPFSAADPDDGIFIGNIAPQSSLEISFLVLVNAIPPSRTLVNTAQVVFTPVSDVGPFPPTTISSNTLSIPVVANSAAASKSANRSTVLAGEQITYTLVLSNTGTTVLNNIQVIDPLSPGVDFVLDSFTINDTTYPDLRPDFSVSLPSLLPGESVTVNYTVFVTGVPITGELSNQATFTFDFEAPDGRRSPGEISTDTVVITVAPDAVIVRKSANASDVLIGEEVTYEIVVTNQGNFTALQPVVTDFIPPGLVFVEGTLLVNGTELPDVDIGGGVSIPDIPPGGQSTISFRLFANAFPNTGRYENTATVSFQVEAQGAVATVLSNLVSLPVLQNQTSFTKAASLSSVFIGDMYAYHIEFANQGTNTLSQITITDLIDLGLELVPGSVTVSVPATVTTTPNFSIQIDSLPAGTTAAIDFTVTASTLPPDFTAYTNTASASFVFTRADGTTVPLTALSDTVVVPVQSLTPVPTPALTVTKSANVATAIIGQTVTFSISITNTSTVPIANISVINILNEGLNFIRGSITVNGNAQPDLDTASVPIGTLLPNESAIVTVQAIILAIPPSGEVVNRAAVQTDTFIQPTNAVVIPVTSASLLVDKTVTPSMAFVGQPLNFTVNVRNAGTAVAENVLFRDPISLGIRIDPDSVQVNGQLVPINSSTIEGLPLGNIGVGQTVTITFTAFVDSITSNGIILNQSFISTEQAAAGSAPVPIEIPSNIVAIPNMDPDLRIIKSSDVSLGFIGSFIDYVIDIQNIGGSELTNFIVRDPLPAGTRFVRGSLMIDGVPIRDLLARPNRSLQVGTIQPNQSIRIAFQLVVVAIPVQGEFANQAIATYNKALPDGTIVSLSQTSNTLIIPFVELNVQMSKRASQSVVVTCHPLMYQVDIINNSNLTLTNAVFIDRLPVGVIFKSDSFTINGVLQSNVNLVGGVPLQAIAPSQSVRITYKVKVITDQGTIQNAALLTFLAQSADGNQGRGELTASSTVTVKQEEHEE
ncbi:DUF7507 domain-containing protein [Paenibacillus agilis]|uniref:DUF11 domain-containing protein n=1 Tax=Paenibacillus agilis TaxID=3020863 RepID=A0A559J039_9BACL|nr:DUF11 domain-containing protein [Paenibacillus agilis]TVX93245.1 DUF11 domain-containing protein [Paenibacillus agilis]